MEIRKWDPNNSDDRNVLAGISADDQGLARLYKHSFGGNVRFTHDTKKWYIWEGDKWCESEKGQILRMAQHLSDIMESCYRNWPIANENDYKVKQQVGSVLKKSKSAKAMREALSLLAAQPGIAMKEEEFDNNSYLFCVKNGVIDLKTGRLVEPKKEYNISKISPVVFNPKAKAYKWHEFLYEVCEGDEEKIRFLQKWVGYSLTADTREEKFVVILGQAGTGKTTFLEVVKHLVGEYGVSTDISTFIAPKFVTPNSPRGDVLRLAKARFVSASEGERGQRFAVGLLKQLTGRDTMSGRPLYGEPVDIIPRCKISLATNVLPEIDQTEQGLWRRMVIIPFVHVPDYIDNHLREKLMEESSGILNWAIEGCILWQQEGLEIPGSIRNFTMDFQKEHDHISQFVEEQCVVQKTESVLSSEIYSRYREWCVWNEEEYVTQKTFISTLKTRYGFRSGREAVTGRKMLQGIGLKKTITDIDRG